MINRDKILQEAQKLVEKKKYDKAIVEYQRLVAEDPNDVRTLLKIGDLHLKQDQYADAISLYERVGQYYAAQGFAVKAVAVYKQIRDIIQRNVPHLEDRFGHIVPKLAELLTQLGLTSDALEYYDQMAARLQSAGRERDAIDIFKKIVGLDPNNPVAHIRLADAYARVRDLDGAVEEYAESSQILLKLGRPDDALLVVERILQHRPEPRFARLAAQVYLSRGQPNDGMAALTKLQMCFKDDPRDLDTLALLAKAFDQLGQGTKAIEVLKEAARIAKEIGRPEVFQPTLAALLERAPNDEVVQRLATMQSSAPPSSAAAEPISVSQVEEVDDIELEVVHEEEEQPIPLRPSQPPASGPVDAVGARVRQILQTAESYRQAGDYQNAVMTLQTGVSGMPQARELRERLCDLLIESGDQEQAIGEMLGFASQLAQTDDPDGAARLLDEVLLLDASNAGALAMLHQLGYAVPESQEARLDYGNEERGANAPAWDYAEAARGGPGYGVPQHQAPPPYGQQNPNGQPYPPQGYDDAYGQAQGPLPSYDLDPSYSQTDGFALDDPFGGGAEPRPFAAQPHRLSDRPPEMPPPGAMIEGPAGLPSFQLEEATQFGIAHDPASYHEEERAPLSQQLDEAALEEIDFFQQHGMLEEAINLLNAELARLPQHPLLLERQREILGLLDQGQAPAAAEPEPGVDDDRAFDIAHALQGLESFESFAPEAAPHIQQQQVSVEAVFEQFKAEVAAQISEGDAATHYDLGNAYKDMGLVTDAIAEFTLAARDPQRECVCQSMIGMLHLQNGNIDGAIDAFLMGLEAFHKTTDQELALTYEVAHAYEQRRNVEQALYWFQRVARLDPSYRDPRGSIEERIQSLEQLARPPQRAAVGALDEFDAAFDEMFKGPKG